MSSPEKEKYQRYLCSREWGVLREKVRDRCGGICENCHIAEMDHVHHLTYERKYHESVEDLRAVCSECHEYVHGKRDIVFRPTGSNVYLAGKISRKDWRHSLVPLLDDDRNDVKAEPDWSVIPNALLWRSKKGVTYGFGYSGPFFVNSEHGLSHGDNTHGCGTEYFTAPLPQPYDIESSNHHGYRVKDFVRAHCLDAIRGSAALFAWIDDPSAFGTLVEIGFASAFRWECHIVIGFPSGFKEMSDLWFAQKCARSVIVAPSVFQFIPLALESLFDWTIRRR